jgi:hypothetical protein
LIKPQHAEVFGERLQVAEYFVELVGVVKL